MEKPNNLEVKCFLAKETEQPDIDIPIRYECTGKDPCPVRFCFGDNVHYCIHDATRYLPALTKSQ